jgi:hypothetical protein
VTKLPGQGGRSGRARRQGGWPAIIVVLALAGLFALIWTPMAPAGWTPPGFCHSVPGAGDDGAPATPGHDHCPLCSAAFGTPPSPLALPTVRFVALRLDAATPLPAAPAERWPAYASRAPPRV